MTEMQERSMLIRALKLYAAHTGNTARCNLNLPDGRLLQEIGMESDCPPPTVAEIIKHKETENVTNIGA